jgi:hypothetical protein
LIARRVVWGFDRLLQRLLHIYDFCDDEKCLLRVSIGKATQDLALSDGVVVHRGDSVGLMHFVNERIPTFAESGPDLSWAIDFRRRVNYSLQLLARHVKATPAFDNVMAFGGEISFGSRYEEENMRTLLRHIGLEPFEPEPPANLWERFIRWGEAVYAESLVWAYNPGSLAGFKSLTTRRDQLWMPRSVLMAKYGSPRRRTAREREGAPFEQQATHEIAGTSIEKPKDH